MRSIFGLHLRLRSIRGVAQKLRGLTEAAGRVTRALELVEGFDELWEAPVAEERYELLYLLIDRIDIDEPAGQLKITSTTWQSPFPLTRETSSPSRTILRTGSYSPMHDQSDLQSPVVSGLQPPACRRRRH